MPSDIQLLHLCERKVSKARNALKSLLPVLGLDEDGQMIEIAPLMQDVGGWHVLEDGTPVEPEFAKSEADGDLDIEIAQTAYLKGESSEVFQVLNELQTAISDGCWEDAEIASESLYAFLLDLPRSAFHSRRNIERYFEDLNDAIAFLIASDFELLWEASNELSLRNNVFEGVDRKIVEGFLQKPESLHSTDPRFFEDLIANVFASFGYDVQLTKRTRDGGRDIVAIGSPDSIHVKYLIECKRYKRERKVSVEQVRQLFGVQQSERATKAILATTSGFTKPARRFAAQHVWELQLIDFGELITLMRRSLNSRL